MSPIDWAMRPLKKYADFSGRAPRAEFWWFTLMLVVLVIVAVIIESMIGLAPIFSAYGPLTLTVLLATLVPSAAVQARRLHDTGRSAWWLVAFYAIYGVFLALASANLEAIAAADGSAMTSVGIASAILMAYSLLLIVFYALRGTVGTNRFGADPRSGQPAFA